MEVDGASNRGINEIRGLRDTVKYLPAKNPYKVYIIDEVHALTNDAFNALLKTLEEPPEHVVFVFATTEAQKVPATILSRCQRYDFKRIRTEDIVDRLKEVAKIENIVAEPDALTIIARQAEGGLRDALGLMDQVIATAGEITAEAVDQSLGLINQNLVAETAKAAYLGDAARALDLLDKAYDLGSDFRELAIKVLEYVRGLTLFKVNPKAAEFLNLTETEVNEFRRISKDLSLSLLHRHFEAWLKVQSELARHPQPRWLLEAHLIKLCQTAPLIDLSALAARLTTFLESSPELIEKNLNLLSLRAQTKDLPGLGGTKITVTAPTISPKPLVTKPPSPSSTQEDATLPTSLSLPPDSPKTPASLETSSPKAEETGPAKAELAEGTSEPKTSPNEEPSLLKIEATEDPNPPKNEGTEGSSSSKDAPAEETGPPKADDISPPNIEATLGTSVLKEATTEETESFTKTTAETTPPKAIETRETREPTEETSPLKALETRETSSEPTEINEEPSPPKTEPTEATNPPKDASTEEADLWSDDLTEKASSSPDDLTEETSSKPTEINEETIPPATEPTEEPSPPKDAATEEPSPPKDAATEEPSPPKNAATEEPSPLKDAATEEPSPPKDAATEEPSPPKDAATEEPSPPKPAATEEPSPPKTEPTEATSPPKDASTEETDSSPSDITKPASSSPDDLTEAADSSPDDLTEAADSSPEDLTEAEDSWPDDQTEDTDHSSDFLNSEQDSLEDLENLTTSPDDRPESETATLDDADSIDNWESSGFHSSPTESNAAPPSEKIVKLNLIRTSPAVISLRQLISGKFVAFEDQVKPLIPMLEADSLDEDEDEGYGEKVQDALPSEDLEN
jgi:DNA polymerase III subunit gamma/tau